MLIGFLSTTLLSKEYWVIEHEFWAGFSLFSILALANYMVGDSVAASLDKQVDARDAKMKAIRQDEIDR